MSSEPKRLSPDELEDIRRKNRLGIGGGVISVDTVRAKLLSHISAIEAELAAPEDHVVVLEADWDKLIRQRVAALERVRELEAELEEDASYDITKNARIDEAIQQRNELARAVVEVEWDGEFESFGEPGYTANVETCPFCRAPKPVGHHTVNNECPVPAARSYLKPDTPEGG